jgi:methionine-rich copper-binding protein CopC
VVKMRTIIAAALGLGIALTATAPAARAHAFLDHASPAVGSTVAATPPVLSLSFTQELEPAFSSVTVTNAAGQRVDLGNAQVPPGAPAELRVGLRPLPPGSYTVNWRVVSVDTHPTEGRFQFTIGR